MYIVAIAWLYVTLLMATAETSWVAGAMTFAFYGVAPLALLLWLFGIPRRARDRRAASSIAAESLTADAAELAADDPGSAEPDAPEHAQVHPR